MKSVYGKQESHIDDKADENSLHKHQFHQGVEWVQVKWEHDRRDVVHQEGESDEQTPQAHHLHSMTHKAACTCENKPAETMRIIDASSGMVTALDKWNWKLGLFLDNHYHQQLER